MSSLVAVGRVLVCRAAGAALVYIQAHAPQPLRYVLSDYRVSIGAVRIIGQILPANLDNLYELGIKPRYDFFYLLGCGQKLL